MLEARPPMSNLSGHASALVMISPLYTTPRVSRITVGRDGAR
jgi:hypothetical protein